MSIKNILRQNNLDLMCGSLDSSKSLSVDSLFIKGKDIPADRELSSVRYVISDVAVGRLTGGIVVPLGETISLSIQKINNQIFINVLGDSLFDIATAGLITFSLFNIADVLKPRVGSSLILRTISDVTTKLGVVIVEQHGGVDYLVVHPNLLDLAEEFPISNSGVLGSNCWSLVARY